ncbi:MAG TPA: prolipoprotein diacylglyceryl transferase [Candidatus Anaerotruncus excrementipullorum]|uniref:Phosphatidylglycerol--prolipoprotein diacylglyceryl transferase n=1 Tax=Candidatus Anaerotruncus excrementipullorum TaxID=2838465 RepID=A0A9D2B7S6_9FIRM|nr:prolipoprotein diacylglyceryl transferase [Candidatus Anaerotruncus excrementipullorum]
MHVIQTVSFPGLGLGPFTLDRVAFTLFGKPIYWYGILIAAAFLAAIGYILKRCRRFGLDNDRAMDVIFGAVILGIIGARIYYVVFSWEDYRNNLADIFKIWNGGIAIYGGIIGGIIGGWLVCKFRKLPFLPMADVSLTGVILAQAIGRWGNFVNVEAFGRATDLPWRMSSPQAAQYLLNTQQISPDTAMQIAGGGLGVHPTFFYESVWCLLGFVLLVLLTSRRRFDGQLTLTYCAWYGAGRSVIEGLRTDSLYWGSVRVSQMLALILVAVSVLLLIWCFSRLHGENPPAFLRLYVDTPEGRAVLHGQPASPEEELVSENAEGESPDAAGLQGDTAEENPQPETEEVRTGDLQPDSLEDSPAEQPHGTQTAVSPDETDEKTPPQPIA